MSSPLETPGPRRDRWGRYLLPDPAGMETTWQRVTTFARYAADDYNLGLWKQRQVARGLASRPDLIAVVASTADPDSAEGKKTLNQACKDAMSAAASSAGANMGTALHAWTEQVDRGDTPTIPAPWDADIAAYSAQLASHGVTVLKEWIETVVTLDGLGVAGTLDRVVEIGGRHYIADVKTGKDPAAFPHDICVQLACYANSDRAHRAVGGEWIPEPMIDVDKDRALVIHLPPGERRCELVWFDIAAGWEGASTSAAVRNWQKRKAVSLTTPFSVETPSLPGNPERTEWLRERLAGVSDETRKQLAAEWPTGVPTGAELRSRGVTARPDTDIDRIAAVLDRIEAENGEPFGPTEPDVRTDPDEGDRLDEQTVESLRQLLRRSPGRSLVAAWAAEAASAGAPISLAAAPYQRRARIMSGAMLAAAADGEAADSGTARAILEFMIGDQFQPTHTVGQALGTLSLQEAARWEELARAFAEGTAELSFDDNAKPVITLAAPAA